MNYYNENDPKAAAWLRELIQEGHIAPGVVDERSIVDVKADELYDFTQCHFFAGIGGWSFALRLAGWPDDEPVWTGSCPCQPFSAAGKGLGAADTRHLWPEFGRLIGVCQPTVTFGEQVASKAGREWLAGVRSDLEGLGYEVGAADLCAAGAGSPHIRQRLYWVADAGTPRRGALQRTIGADGREAVEPDGHGDAIRLADTGRARTGRNPRAALSSQEGMCGQRDSDGLHGWDSPFVGGAIGWVEHPARDGREQRRPESIRRGVERGRTTGNPWHSFDILLCTDGKSRRIEPGSFPLAHGVSGRVGLLRGYGNAIVPQVGAQFIEAYLEIRAATNRGDRNRLGVEVVEVD